MGLFSGVKTAKMSNRNDKPKVGNCICLLKSASYQIPERSKEDFIKYILEVAVPGVDRDGLRFGDEGFEGNRPGEVLDVCYFEDKNGIFYTDIMRSTLAIINAKRTDVVDDDEFTDAMEAEGKVNMTFYTENLIPAIFGVEEGQKKSTIAGNFDDKCFVEIKTVTKRSKNLDDAGNAKVFENTHFVKRVSFEEVALTATDDQIKKWFGSMEKFEELKAEDKQYM